MGDKEKVIIGLAIASAAGIGLYFWLKKKPEEPVCQEGQTQTRTCPDGSVITTHTCVGGKWQATGATCPTPPSEEEGYLTVTTDPSNASFTAEGPATFTQYTNFTNKKIPVGNYDYLIKKVGYLDVEGNFDILKDQTTTVSKTLTPIPEQTLLVTYGSSDDYYAAKWIYDDLNQYYDVTLKNCAALDELSSYDAVAIVGGQLAWEQCYQNLFNLLYFTQIDESHTGGFYVQKRTYQGAVVYAIAGALKEDTERSADYFTIEVKRVGLMNVQPTL